MVDARGPGARPASARSRPRSPGRLRGAAARAASWSLFVSVSGPIQLSPRIILGRQPVPPSQCLVHQLADRPERLAQVEVELPVDAIGAVVEGLDPGIERRGLDDPDGGVARLGDRGESAGADLGEQRDAEGRPFGRVERLHVAAVDVRLDLPPEGIAGAAAGDAHLLDRHAHLADQLEAVAHGEGRTLEHAADHVRPAVADGQADPGPLGIRVEMGRALARQVGEEEQPLGPGSGDRGLVGQQEVGILAPLPSPWRPRPCPARCGTTGSCRPPPARRP